jgi:hypothetical protein
VLLNGVTSEGLVDDSSIPRPPGQAAARAQEGEVTASSTSLKFFFLTLAAKPFFCDIIRAINLKFFTRQGV